MSIYEKALYLGFAVAVVTIVIGMILILIKEKFWR